MIEPPDAEPALDERKWHILRAIVSEHVTTGEPVGSRHVVEAASLDVSAATVRNDMAALEEMGYIHQPHTSAGRVPTDRGYRSFVDHVDAGIVDEAKREAIAASLEGSGDTEDVLLRATHVLSQLTHLVSLVIAPTVASSRLKLLELVSLAPHAVLLIAVTDTGRVEKRLIELAKPVTEADVERAGQVLNEAVRGERVTTLATVVERVATEAPTELRALLHAVSDASAGLEEPRTDHVFVGGAASLADREGLTRQDLSRVLELLEERVTLARLLAESAQVEQPIVRIGEEHDVEGLQTTTLVAQGYRVVSAGSLGVLGPTRMDYTGVLATVKLVADELQATLQHLSEG